MEGIECKRQNAKPLVRQVAFDGKGKSGKLLEWKVEEGESIKANTVLGLIRTANNTAAIRSKYKGTILKLQFKEGNIIADG